VTGKVTRFGLASSLIKNAFMHRVERPDPYGIESIKERDCFRVVKVGLQEARNTF
jgi:hypothetical protein